MMSATHSQPSTAEQPADRSLDFQRRLTRGFDDKFGDVAYAGGRFHDGQHIFN